MPSENKKQNNKKYEMNYNIRILCFNKTANIYIRTQYVRVVFAFCIVDRLFHLFFDKLFKSRHEERIITTTQRGISRRLDFTKAIITIPSQNNFLKYRIYGTQLLQFKSLFA